MLKTVRSQRVTVHIAQQTPLVEPAVAELVVAEGRNQVELAVVASDSEQNTDFVGEVADPAEWVKLQNMARNLQVAGIGQTDTGKTFGAAVAAAADMRLDAE